MQGDIGQANENLSVKWRLVPLPPLGLPRYLHAGLDNFGLLQGRSEIQAGYLFPNAVGTNLHYIFRAADNAVRADGDSSVGVFVELLRPSSELRA